MRYLLALMGWRGNREPVAGIYKVDAESEEQARRECVGELSSQMVLVRIVCANELGLSPAELLDAVQTQEWWEEHERSHG
jgi:hypothetical protein